MLKKTFCSSPWFHLGINYDGSFSKCRWARDSFLPDKKHNLTNTSILEFYNSSEVKELRSELLSGNLPSICQTCNYEESFGKINGRIRQLTKSAIELDNFELSTRSSPHYKYFKHSLDNNGESLYQPTDLQIYLGNTCNSACIMCEPFASSRLETEYRTLAKQEPDLFQTREFDCWTRNNKLVDDLLVQLSEIENLGYIHFLGGETLYDKSFYKICDALIESGQSKDVMIGTTTNCTINNDKIKEYITKFKSFHLGISIETVTSLNDYIRYPGKIDQILANLKQFLRLRENNDNLYISLRITPNVFSIAHIDTLFKFALRHRVILESCNILVNPECLRIENIPDNIRQIVLDKLSNIISEYSLSKHSITNIRSPEFVDQATADSVVDYYKFIKTYNVPDNVDRLRTNLVRFIKAFENNRGNKILEYLPEYEEFLRAYGY